MENLKILETVADISYMAGYHQHYSGNSRFDIKTYVSWAYEFEEKHKNTDWDQEDYILMIEEFANTKIATSNFRFD